MFNNRIFFSQEEILRIKHTTDEKEKSFALTLLAEAEALIADPDQVTRNFEFLGYGYYYTGKQEYVDKAYKSMYACVHDNAWYSHDYNPAQFEGYDIKTVLETAYHCIAMSYGLSIFGNLIPADDAKYLAEKTFELGIKATLEEWVLPGTRSHALDTMGHNFWIAIISAAGLAAVVLKDSIPDADYYIQAAVRAAKAWFDYQGNPMNSKPQTMDNGAYYEGIGYFTHCFNEYLKFAIVYKNAMGTHPFDDTAYLEAAGKFLINCSYVNNYYAGFGDCGLRDFRAVPLFLIRYGIRSNDLCWYIQNTTDQKEARLTNLLVWHEARDLAASEPKARSACYDKIGWAMFKNGMTEDSAMLAIKCGDTWNHAHADAAHFILFRNGRPEIYDSMVTHYSTPVYQGYFVTSQAHNVLLFNDRGQDYRDNFKNHAHLPGRLLNFTDDHGFRYVVADGTGPMGRYFRKHHRHFLWMDDFILIYDDVECYECGKISFLRHAQKDNCFRMLSAHTIETKMGHKPNDELSPRPYLSYNTMTDDDAHAKLCSVLLLDESLEPKFTEIKNGWKLEIGSKIVYINHRAAGKVVHRNCINEFDGIITDAEILVDAGDGKFAVANGSMVRRNGTSYLDVLARITGWADDTLR